MKNFLQSVAITILLVAPLLLMNLDPVRRLIETWWLRQPFLFSSIFFAPAVFLLIRSLWKSRRDALMHRHGN